MMIWFHGLIRDNQLISFVKLDFLTSNKTAMNNNQHIVNMIMLQISTSENFGCFHSIS